MEGTALYNLVEMNLRPYRKKLEENAAKYFSDCVDEREKLKEFLNDEQLKNC